MWINTFCYIDSPHIFYTSKKGLIETLQLHHQYGTYVRVYNIYIHIGVCDIIQIYAYICMYVLYVLGVTCVEYINMISIVLTLVWCQ